MSPVIFCSGDRHTKTRTNAANRGMVGLKQCNPCLPSLAQVLALTTMIVGTTVVERVRRTPTMRSPAAGAAEEQAKSLYVRARELPLALQRRGGQGRRLRGVCDGYGHARHGGRRADAEDTDHALAREMVTSRETGKVPRLRLTASQGRVGRRGSGAATGQSAPVRHARHHGGRVSERSPAPDEHNAAETTDTTSRLRHAPTLGRVGSAPERGWGGKWHPRIHCSHVGKHDRGQPYRLRTSTSPQGRREQYPDIASLHSSSGQVRRQPRCTAAACRFGVSKGVGQRRTLKTQCVNRR